MPRLSRSAFTLVELLVVIAIIAVLIGLLLPAVQKVRESGSRVKCINNMKQLNLALQQYESKLGRIPASTTDGSIKTGTMVHFLPFIEQEAIWSQYDFSKSWHLQKSEVLTAQPAIFLCPSSPNTAIRGYAMTSTYDLTNLGICDYASVTRLHVSSPSAYSIGLLAPFALKSGDADGVNPVYQGLMGKNRTTRLSDVVDGVSNTLTFVEDVGRPMRLLAKKIPLGFYPATDALLGSGWAQDTHPMDYQGYSDSGASAGGPCGMNCSNYNEIFSVHFNGGVFGFADGSVKFLASRIDPRTLSYLITKAGTRRGEDQATDY